MIELRDIITNQFYAINTQSISCFTKEKNCMGVMRYYIILNNGIKITITHKKWNKIKKMI